MYDADCYAVFVSNPFDFTLPILEETKLPITHVVIKNRVDNGSCAKVRG